MNITQCQVKDERIIVVSEELNEATQALDENSLKSYEPPLPSFTEAFGKFKSHLADLCEIRQADAKRLTVDRIDIENGDSHMSIIIHGACSVSKSKGGFSLKSPKYTYLIGQESAKDQGDKKNVMPKACYDDLIVLISECKKYISGERSQNILPFDKPEVDETDGEELNVNMG